MAGFHVIIYGRFWVFTEDEFANNTFPLGLSGLIHHNSGGNALFMVAIVRDIAKRGLIRQDCGIWNLTGPLQEIYRGIPETLQEMLDLQFGQLSVEEQRILQSCSVVGERFSVWLAAVLLDESPISIEETCDKLAQRQQFIRSVGIHQAPNGGDSTITNSGTPYTGKRFIAAFRV